MNKFKKRKKEKNKKPDLFKPHVLIVEDSKEVQTVIKNMILSLGCKVDVADTGKEAITMYKGNYDLVFLDIYLPDMTGLGVYIAIRSQEKLRHIPIIAITVDEKKEDECLAIGFDEFIVKPIINEKCEEILKRWLSKNNFYIEKEANSAVTKKHNKKNNIIKKTEW